MCKSLEGGVNHLLVSRCICVLGRGCASVTARAALCIELADFPWRARLPLKARSFKPIVIILSTLQPDRALVHEKAEIAFGGIAASTGAAFLIPFFTAAWHGFITVG